MQNEDETPDHIERLKRLAEALMDAGSDWKAGLSGLINEVERHEPGFIQRIAAQDALRRLGCRPLPSASAGSPSAH